MKDCSTEDTEKVRKDKGKRQNNHGFHGFTPLKVELDRMHADPVILSKNSLVNNIVIPAKAGTIIN